MYHRVTPVARDPFGLSVTPETFASHLERLQKLGEIVPLDAMRVAGSPWRFAITFDDGYRDNATHAGPVLRRCGATGTVFVTSGHLGGSGFWWDRLDRMITSATAERLTMRRPERPLEADLRSEAGRDRAVLAVQRRVRRLPPEDIDAVLDELEDALSPRCREVVHPPMTTGELRELAQDGHVEIGAHTVSHPVLAALPRSRQREEILRSKSDLEAILGRPVRHFAYPFGDSGTFDLGTARMVRAAGFRSACSTREAPVTRYSGRFALPRLAVREWSPDELDRRVRAWIEP
jgi:peptidoglycan/xylan/chitin deacetylase (PgdA/CDA1 family)